MIIGIHAPEFEFEQDLNNVQPAVTRLGVLYPVALDNQYTPGELLIIDIGQRII